MLYFLTYHSKTLEKMLKICFNKHNARKITGIMQGAEGTNMKLKKSLLTGPLMPVFVYGYGQTAVVRMRRLTFSGSMKGSKL